MPSITFAVGNIQINKTVIGTAAPSPWNFQVSSNNCNIPSSAVTAAATANGGSGTATFTGLPANIASVTCLYDVIEIGQNGYSIDLDTVALSSLEGLLVTDGGTTEVDITNESVAACVAGNDLGGNVFRDYNADGVDAGINEPPVSGITVHAYDEDNNLVASTILQPDGSYNFPGIFVANSDIRLEFDNFPVYLQSSSAGTNSGTQTQIHTASTCTADLALANPVEYCQADPDMAASTYVRGNQTSGRNTVYRTSYDVSTTGNTPVATDSVVGSVWGLAYDSGKEALFTASFLKRHAGFGPGDHDAIYVTDLSGGANTTSVFLEFEAAGIGIDVGDDTVALARDLGAPGTPTRDIAAYTKVGKQSFGDIDFDETNNTLWVMNLFDRRLYGISNIDLATPPAIEDFLRDSNNDLGFLVDTVDGITCTDGVLRPFALKIKDNKLYAGATCTAELVDDVNNLSIHVLEMDLDNTALGFQLILSESIDETRDKLAFGIDLEWNSWAATDLIPGPAGYPRVSPAPWLMDIEFDNDGSMILAIGDRHGHLMAQGEFFPNATNNTLYNGATDVLGDIYRVCHINGIYVLEGQPGCANNNPRPVTEDGGNAGVGSRGPSGGEYYVGDWGPTDADHYAETLAGGLAMLPGSDQVAMVALDAGGFNSGGISWLFNADGTRSGGRNIYFTPGSELPTPPTFGKSGGMGDIEILCDDPPIEIGNRVWNDSDADGVQDPDELPISGVEVQLYEWNDDGDGIYQAGELGAAVMQGGSPVTATTSATGEYYFGQRSGDPSLGFVGDMGLSTNTKYIVAINTTQNALLNTPEISPVTTNVAGGTDGETNASTSTATNDKHDSDGIEGVETNLVIAPLMTGAVGENDHTYDFGFYPLVSLGSTVWEDLNGDGTQDSGETPILNAKVTLLNDDGTDFDNDPGTPGVQVLEVFTDGDGQYNFNDLPPGDYRVEVDLSTVVNGSDLIPTPMQVADPDAAGPGQDNNTDSNVDLAFDANTSDQIHTSGIITLVGGAEPTGETDPIGAGGADQPNQGLTTTNDPDNSGNMTVDFGFVRPVSVGSTVWKDLDADGVQDASEPAITGATVTLLNADGTVFDSDIYTAGVQALTDITDADGQYNFDMLPAGDYRIQVNLATATNPNASSFIPTPPQITDPDAAGPGQDNNTDSNIDAAFDTNTNDQIHTSGVVSLTASGEPTGETDPIGAGGADQPNQGLTPSNDPDANGNMTVDFGFIEPVSIGSTVWFDSDGDGIQDVTEPAIVGVTVTLLNANGTVYDSDPVTAGIQALTDITDGDGQYNFNGLPEGDYRVQVDLNTATSHIGGSLQPTPTQVADPDAAGPGQDNNTDSNVDNAAPGHNPAGNIYQSGIVTLSLGGEPTGETDPIGAGGADQPNQTALQPDNNGNMTVDFGFIAPVSLGSTIWEDTDADGVQDAAEPAIIGATVTLLNANGTVYDSNPNVAGIQALTDVTDADGQYNFDGLPPGDYRVQVNLSTVTGGDSYIPTPLQVADPDAAGPGQDNNTDSNVDTAFDPNVNDLIHTSGIVTLSVGGEPTGETDPIGAGGADQPNQGLTATDDPDSSGNMTVDMGFIKPVSLGSTAWLDSDEDGTQDASEPAIVGATVTLLNDDGTVFDSNPNLAGIQALTDITDADGQYNFNDLPEGDYRVRIDLSTATNPNASTFVPTPPQVADPDAAGPGQDNNTDSNIDASFDTNTADQIHTSGVISLSVGGEPTGETDPIGAGGADQPNQALTAANQPDANGNMTVDFGFMEPVSLGSLVWLDSDADGVQDAAEPAITGATVTLLNDDGTVYDSNPAVSGVQAITNTTDASGLYNFNGLPEGDYRVQVDLNTATSHTGGYLASTPTQVADPDAAGPGQDNNTDSNIDDTAPGHNPAGNIYQSGIVTLSIGGEPASEADTIIGGTDQPNQTATQPDLSGNMTVDFGFIQPVSLGSTLWQDLDGDGVQDNAEPAIIGATVTLLNGDGTVFDSDPNTAGIQSLTDTTDADGQYNFDGLPPGDYRVQVDLSTVTGGGELFPTPVQVADPDAAGPGQDNNTDSNVDFAYDANLTDQIHTSGVITLSSGLEPTGETDPIGAGGADQPNQGLTAADDPDNSGNMTVDFGFVLPVSLGSTLWQDTNGDGTQDDNEPAIAGATVTLLNADGTVFDSDPYTSGVQPLTTPSDAQGQYNFNALPPGDYRVQVDVTTVTSGLAFVPTPTQVADPDAAGPGQDNNTDSNIDTGAPGHDPANGVYQSGIVTLTAGGEPTGEADPIDGVDNNGDVTDQPNQDANDPDNSGNMTVDFGFIAPVSIGSFVWDDLNGDGLQTANEPPIAGSQVELLVETSTPGVFVPATDLTSAVVATQTTGTDGLYFFDNLPPNNYKVRVTPPSGYFPTPVQTAADDDDTENDSNINLSPTTPPPAGSYESGVFTLESGAEPQETDVERGDAQDQATAGSPLDLSGNMTVDFGFTRPASIGNYVWVDLDRDGVQDANEDPIPGVTVSLMPPPGVDIGAGPGNPITTVTDANGGYLFPDLPPFVDPDPSIGYVVSVDPATVPATYVQTYDEGLGGATGVLDHTSDPIQLDPEEFHETADFGYVPADGTIGDTIWIDANGDGVQDLGEQGIPNVTVTLTPAPDVDLGNGLGVPIVTMTDANGKYLFTNLPLDEVYIVTVDETTLPPGYTSDPDGDGDPDVRDGNSTAADGVTVITLTPEAPINLDADFGYLPPADQNNSVGDTVWLDVDGDGTQNNGEAGLGGVTVDLIDNATGTVIATTVTDANGNYLFLGVPDGLYDIVVTDTNGILNNYDQTFDDDGLGTPNTSQVDLDSASVSPTPIEDLDQDFGYNDPAANLGSIGDTVFFDQDGDGQPGATEGIEGVIVELYDSNGVLIASTTTDVNGNYLFTDLPVSATGEQYTVVVDTSSLPNGGASSWTNSVDPNGGGDSTSIYTLTDAEPVNLDQDFGYIGAGNNSIEGTVWSDTDGDGEQAESGTFAGVTIELRDENGNVIATTVTDANGDYSFTGLPDGIYMVVVTDDDNVLASYEHTDSPNGTSDTSDQTSKDDTGYTVDLDSTGSNADPVVDTTGDFGYMPVVTNPISLASFKAEKSGSKVILRWTTQTEVGNLGFYIYAQQNGEWVRISESLIPSQGDSTQVQTYSQKFASQAKYFAISDIDLYGKETLHGPFKIGKQHGIESERKPIDWTKPEELMINNGQISNQSNQAVSREVLKRQQMLEKSAQRQQLR